MSKLAMRDAILERLSDGLLQRFEVASAEDVDRLDPDEVAATMLAALPTRHPFGDLGPFYDTAGLTRRLGVTRQALSRRVLARTLLAPETGDGQRVYPARQFLPDGTVVPGLREVLAVLLAATDPWTATIWLATPTERLQGRSGIDVLRGQPGDTTVIAAAREDAARWTIRDDGGC